MKFIRIGTLLCAALVILGGVLGWWLVTARPEPLEKVQEKEFTRSKFVATQDLPAFTLIQQKHLQALKGTKDLKPPDDSNLLNRYLLTSINQGGEVKDSDLAPVAATEVLNDALTVSVASSAATSLGGQLRVGDVVELLAVQSGKPPVKLVVLNPGNKDANPAGTITFAVAAGQREQFATAVGATALTVTRKIDVNKQ